ncbi:MAG TPA: glucose-6-phosphate dehydrogenase assembly protein OpcA [Pyrinomonadaceae bacterium]|nr:glucose-6-phosphate dehydrogenase assembly protein OpcA [Pyrinomonadaceae bacterium]
MQQIALGKTLDVEVVEQELDALWQGSTTAARPEHAEVDERPDDETPVLRARAANLLVYVSDGQELEEVHQLLQELTTVHPSRVLTMFGENDAPDNDIEMFVSTLSQKEKAGGQKRLCCEEVTLKAQGSFVSELPSATLPLLVSDLPTFLWWRSEVDGGQKVFRSLLHAADRLIVDSVEFENPVGELLAVNKIFQQDNETAVGISDLNWARLTSWRGLLADFYDVPEYGAALERIDNVCISYVAPEADETAIAPQALLMAGWLASRLQWAIKEKPGTQESERTLFEFANQGGGTITVELLHVKGAGIHPGRLAHVELRSQADGSAFKVERSADLQRVLTEAKLGSNVNRGRVLPVRNRSTAQLLSREMEILCNDQIYQDALKVAASLIERFA